MKSKSKIYAVSGKGGVGKTTFLALTLKSLIKNGSPDIIVLDADPAANIGEVVGLHVPKTIADIADELKVEIEKRTTVDKQRFLEGKIQSEILQEADEFDLLAMGSIEKDGCYCFINSLLRQAIDGLVASYDIALADMPAGLEHFNRRTIQDVDILFIVTDPSKMGLNTALRIKELTQKLKINVKNLVLVGNRVSPDIEPILQEFAQTNGFKYGGSIPNDSIIQQANLKGISLLELEDSPAVQKIEQIVNQFAYDN
ncbi:MAG: ArsA-related P-loop ATPase [Candidatus Hermodarchaeota archaeon]